ncbi:MAG TPA: circadian clock KaiB family protein [Stellaceae bacterium]|nr:circadian clock KaiB family protein [Stellaceae bacterium]
MGPFRLQLYIAGDTPISQKARENLQRLCERHPAASEAVVIDILSEPALADEARILATPTLICEHLTRSKRIIGDLGDTDRVAEFLGLQQHPIEP